MNILHSFNTDKPFLVYGTLNIPYFSDIQVIEVLGLEKDSKLVKRIVNQRRSDINILINEEPSKLIREYELYEILFKTK